MSLWSPISLFVMTAWGCNLARGRDQAPSGPPTERAHVSSSRTQGSGGAGATAYAEVVVRGDVRGTAPRRCGTAEMIEDAVDHLGSVMKATMRMVSHGRC